MRGWSFPAGRLFGVDIRIHVTFLFLLGFVWFSESLNMGTSGPGRGLALVAIIFGCVVLHELAHAIVAKQQRYHCALHRFIAHRRGYLDGRPWSGAI